MPKPLIWDYKHAPFPPKFMSYNLCVCAHYANIFNYMLDKLVAPSCDVELTVVSPLIKNRK